MINDTHSIMKACRLCPRECGADRTGNRPGYCNENSTPVCARAALHMWEEPCISGTNGSGAVFFSGCNLRCVFCQNFNISRARAGKEISIQRLCEIFLELQSKNAHNINLVTPTHFVPQIIEALELARSRGLSLPIVYNTSGYEKAETIRMLAPYVNVWLPDFKYKSAELASRYSKAPDYFERAGEALAVMVESFRLRRASGISEFDANGIMQNGVIVRHLVLPGCVPDSKRVLRYLHETYGDDIYISILNQFTPSADLTGYPELNRTVSPDEYNRVLEFAHRIGITRGFTQSGEAAKESFIPEFDCTGV